MMELVIVAVVSFVLGAVSGALFYRRHRARIEAAADAAWKT